MKRKRSPLSQVAFTLLELLIAIAIAATLLLLMFAAVRGAAGGAKAARCLGNLRQIGAMFQSYLADHQMTYPFSVMRPTSTAPNRFWAQELVEHEGRLSLLGSFICPGVKDINADLKRHIGGYAYVSYAINRYGVAPAMTDNYLPARQMSISEASRLLLILDFDTPGQPSDGWYTATRQGARNEWATLKKRHESVNGLFCDGHVEKLDYDQDTSGTDSVSPWRSFVHLTRP